MPTEEINGEYLRNSRAHCFEKLTSVLDSLNEQLAKPNFKQVKARFSFLPKLCEKFANIEAQILLYNSHPKREDKLTLRNERKAMDDVVTKIHEVYEEIMESEQRTTMEIAPSRLPKLQLPKFSGNFREWQSFKEVYEAMIHSSSLPHIEKFQRLKGCLQGEPLQLIEHFPLSGENYPFAYQALVNRYDNPRIAANSYLHALLNFKPCQGDSHAALQAFLANHLDTIKAYKALDLNDRYDYLLFQICYGHLDKRTQRAFDEKYPVDRFPTYENLMQFIQDRLRTLELHWVENEKGSKGPVKHTFNITEQRKKQDKNPIKTICYACTDSHPLVTCPRFLKLSISERYEVLKSNNLCFNCFRKLQRTLCNSSKRCKHCGKNHHTLLHSGGDGRGDGTKIIPRTDKPVELHNEQALTHTVICTTQNPDLTPKTILLSTAQGFIVHSKTKSAFPVRILLDPGSQVSCISQEMVAKLGVSTDPEVTYIKGVSDTAVQSQGRTDCVIYTNPKCTRGFRFRVLVLPSISAILPEIHVHDSIGQKFNKYKLADPHFDKPGQVDVLIGADHYYDIVINRKILKGKPNGIPTSFGLVLTGEALVKSNDADVHSFALTLDTLNQTLTKFWETEEPKVTASIEDDWCEQFFQKTVTRTHTGRYVVALPFTCDNPEQVLGDNRKGAFQRLSGRGGLSVGNDVEGLVKVCDKFSSLTKLTRVFGYILRFSQRSLRKPACSGPLKLNELKAALIKCVWLNQVKHYERERTLIKNNSPVSALMALSPFLDKNDLLRVGGRLGNTPLPYDARHPMLVPYNTNLARLIVEYYHKVTLHGGPQITRAAIQHQYWIPKIGNLIKSVIFSSTICRRQNTKPLRPQMGELPPSRFDQVRPFLRVGTDFAGPFTLKETLRRKAPLFKAYLCLFVCLSTKAVHLEVVTSLSADSFMAALDRFIARRGLCATMYSDNGTNFTGATRKLSEVADFLARSARALDEQLTLRHIQWIFNPPAAPHMGGLWEAAVMSFKFHLNRVSTSHIFTFEEFTTLTCRIEAILNSRPCPH